MTSNAPNNRFFAPPRATTLADDEVRSYVRSELFYVRSRFVDRLACAQVFDRELFDAVILWLDTLSCCYAAANLPMASSDFSQFDSITGYLEQAATYSRDQRAECATAHMQWIAIMRRFHLLPETKP
jgi:hypothetical protein